MLCTELALDPCLFLVLDPGMDCDEDTVDPGPPLLFLGGFFLGLNLTRCSLRASLKVSMDLLNSTGWKILNAPAPERENGWSRAWKKH